MYEYPLNGQWIMLDMDDGYVLWTGIWKGSSFCYRPFPCLQKAPTALGNNKGMSYRIHAVHPEWRLTQTFVADIVKIIDSQPDLAPQLRRVRGGYLKIQGTWMPYEIALRLARRSVVFAFHLVGYHLPANPQRCLAYTSRPRTFVWVSR